MKKKHYAAYRHGSHSFKERFVGNFNILFSAKTSIKDTGGSIYRFFANGNRDFTFDKLIITGE